MAVKIDAFLALEASLSSRVVAAWGKVSATALPLIYSRLQNKDVLGATRMVDNLDLSPIIRDCRDYIHYMSYASMLFGASRINPQIDQAKSLTSGNMRPMVNRVTASYASVINTSVGDQVKARLYTAIQEHDLSLPHTNFSPSDGNVVFKADQQTILRPYVEFKNPINSEAQRMIQMVSSLHTTRLAAYGYTEEANLLGVQTYSINEQLDNRICPVCEVMHGRTFKVSVARSLLERTLLTDDPEQLKVLQEWPSQSKASVQALRGMSSEDVVARGWHIPPYHPWCRGQLVKEGEVPNLEDTPSYQSAFPETEGDTIPPEIDEASFDELGVDVTPEEAAAWAAETDGTPPEEFLSGMTGLTPQEMSDAAYDPVTDTSDSSQYGVDMTLQTGTEEERLKVLLELQGQLLGLDDAMSASMEAVFGTTENVLHVEGITTSLRDSKSMPDIMAAWVAAAMAVGIDTIELDPTEDPTDSMWSDYGAVPSDADWSDGRKALQEAITDDSITLTEDEKALVLPILDNTDTEGFWELMDLDIPAVDEFMAAQDMTVSIDLADELAMERFNKTTG